jgi:phenylacetate-coenzyme A ligase PaaK-like adenylate-forming protein
MPDSIQEKVFAVGGDSEFSEISLELFRFQYHNNEIYRRWCEALGKKFWMVGKIEEIPFLPVSFFKTHMVYSSQLPPVMEFSSSGTTAGNTSRHYVADPAIYEKSFLEGFRHFYGDPADYCILALLPGYLEREGSSLVYMVRRLIEIGGDPNSGFYLDQMQELYNKLIEQMSLGKKIFLIGVSFALIDFAEKYPLKLHNAIVMETGGMKGRRREIIRHELHQVLQNAFNVQAVHSEYGMTELFSQAYSTGEGVFYCPPWMRIMLRDANDPISASIPGRPGGINIIDLANIHSCSFIATEDLGKMHPGGGFEVLGRFDHSDTRGCNLMVV